MKAKMIALVALSVLILTPAYGAPRKMKASGDSKPVAAKSAPSSKETRISPQQAGARELLEKLTSTQKSRMLALLNEGTAVELSGIKGVSKSRAAAIEKARPFKSIDEVILVGGIGKRTVSEIVNHAHTLTATRKKSGSASSSAKRKS